MNGLPETMLLPEKSTRDVGRGFPDEWIAVAAYYIWEKEGRPAGRNLEHWNQAKAQLGEHSAGNLADFLPDYGLTDET